MRRGPDDSALLIFTAVSLCCSSILQLALAAGPQEGLCMRAAHLEALLDDVKWRHACVADDCGSRPGCSSACKAGLRRRLAQALLCCLIDCKVHRMRRPAWSTPAKKQQETQHARIWTMKHAALEQRRQGRAGLCAALCESVCGLQDKLA